MGITTSGVGSGIDIASLVQQLVAVEGEPAATRLDRREATFQAQLSAIGSFKGALSTFQSALSTLVSFAAFNQRSATSSDETSFTATADGSAVAGSYSVKVVQLAQAQTLTSEPFVSATETVGTGTLTFQFGDPTLPAQSVVIDGADGTLEGIRNAVNAAKIGVQASIVHGDAGYQLVFSSGKSGLDNALKITVAESPTDGTGSDMNGLSRLAYDPEAEVGNGRNMTEAIAAKDAIAEINSIQVTSASNSLSGAIEGLTLNLLKETPATAPTLTVALDTAAVRTRVTGFVQAYNALISTVQTIAGYDATTQTGGVLVGDAGIRGIVSQLRNILGRTVPGLQGGFCCLADIGITTKSDGTLAIDGTRLNAAVTDHFDEVGKLFAAWGTPSDSRVRYETSTAATKAGSFPLAITQAATRGSYSDPASILSSLTVDEGNDTFAVKVDGISSGTISITRGLYGSGAELAAELQSRINGDSALQAAGASVIVSYDGANNRFVFTSNRYGSDSAVEISWVEETAASAAIGLTVAPAASTPGTDVAGTLGRTEGTGTGQYLTGAGEARGLRLKIEGDDLGDHGTVDFGRGIADQLNTLLKQLLSGDNILDARSESLNASISSLSEQRAALNRRLEALEARYKARFIAMDALVAKLNTTGEFLTRQLASLNNLLNWKDDK